MKAEIITIGDEILIGQIVDTNSAWIAEQFNLNGIEIYQITSVHDDRQHILDALSNAEENADLVVMTGGLGPTKDDITRSTLCEYFNTELVFHEPTFRLIEERFRFRNILMSKLNRDQAMLPSSCTVLFNRSGTAPGMWFEKNNTIFVSVPGVPFEMKDILTYELLPRLRATGKTKAIFHKTVLTQGLPESVLAEKIDNWETRLPPFIKVAYLPGPMAVKLRLSAYGDDIEFMKKSVDSEIKTLFPIIGDYIFGFDDDQLAGVVGKSLSGTGKTLSVAESCTGGYISHLITSVPGCSVWYKGSVTAYSNEVKKSVLGVSETSLQQFGAVSEQVAIEMAAGVKKALQTDYSVATTGIAGPDGGTPDKPVGTVWIAVSGKKGTHAAKFVFDNNRERNIIRSGQTALQTLRRLISEEK
jgi:nicotinamide-nucleotide amidase